MDKIVAGIIELIMRNRREINKNRERIEKLEKLLDSQG